MKGFHVRVRPQVLDTRALAAILVSLMFVLPTAWADEPGADDLYLETIEIPAGPFIAGSDQAERETAYALDEAAMATAGPGNGAGTMTNVTAKPLICQSISLRRT